MKVKCPLIVLFATVLPSLTAPLEPQGTLKLQILHTNDMHARFEETSRASGVCPHRDAGKRCLGGFARVAHVVMEARRRAQQGGPPVLFLNAGDTYTGTAWFGVHRWKIVSDFLNALQPDAMSLGNHEFDDGVNGLIPFIKNSTVPILAANLDYTDEPELGKSGIQKSIILDVADRRIGVIGYLTPETKKISNCQEVKFIDEVIALREESERLAKDGIKTIIALGHSGFETDKRIAKEVPLVDIVIGGHTNTFLWNGPKIDLEEPEGPYPVKVTQPSGKVVPVVQAYAYTKYVGVLNITLNAKGNVIASEGQPLLTDISIPQEETFLDKLEVYRAEVEMLDKKIVGRSKVVLQGDVTCRTAECNFGNLIADAYVAYHMSLYGGTYWTDTPIGLINGGGIRNSIEPHNIYGSITRGEILGALPFDNRLVTMTLNGSDLIRTLEIGVRANGKTSLGEFLQVSGLKVSYDMSRPPGQRVLKVEVRCSLCKVPRYEPIDLTKEYRVITISFLDNGGDDHHVLRNNGFNKRQEDLNDLDALSWYMGQYSPVFPEEQGRIMIIRSSADKIALPMILIVCIALRQMFVLF